MKVDSAKQRERMLHEPAGKLLFRLACPTVIIQMITIVYNTADTYFVSKINTSASAAVGVVFSLMAVIQAIGYGVGMGANSLISRQLGMGNDEQANRYGSSAVFAALFLGLCIMALGLINTEKLMVFLGSTNTMLPYACDYARYILIGAPFMCLSFVLNNILRSEGEAFFAMIGMTTGGVLNMILDPLFIFVLHMGIAGAALATMFSQIVGMMILASVFVLNKSIVRLKIGSVSRNIRDYLAILKSGFPTICRQGLASVASALLNIKASYYGDAAVAAITISNKIYMLVRNVVLGIGQGYQPIAGYCYGANDKKRVRKLFSLSCMAGTAICTLSAIVIFMFSPQIIHWFRDDAEVVAIGSTALRFACVVMPLMAYSTYVNQTYQCLGFSFGATILACCRQGIFFIPLALVLPSLLKITGIQMLQPMADLLTFLISVPFQIVFFRKYLKAGDADGSL